MTEMRMRRVGGWVRDAQLGLKSKDVDFQVELPELIGRPSEVGFAEMVRQLVSRGFEPFEERLDMLTLRARFPREHELFGRLTADFVLSRVEGPYSDGRHPDWVRVGDFHDDLARRDFSCNAMALEEDGTLVDPFDGLEDLRAGALRFVGQAEQRLREDTLRALRALRFCVTKGLEPDPAAAEALQLGWVVERVGEMKLERRREELRRCMEHDTLRTLDLLHSGPFAALRAPALRGLRLNPTSQKRLSQGD